MIKERQKARMKNFGAAGAEMDDENQAKRRALKQAEYDREFERLTLLANTRTPYQDHGDRIIYDMRQQQLEQEKEKSQTTKVRNYLPSLYGKDGKIDVKKFNPSATELLKMTPSQKQNLINRIKLVQKKAEEEEALDPDTIKSKIASGEVNPCEGFKQFQMLEELKQKSQKKGAKVLSVAEAEGQRRAKSVGKKPAIFQRFG